MSTKVARIKQLQGLKSAMPTLLSGELAFTTDEKKLYVGDGTNAIEVLTGSVDLTEITSKVNTLIAPPSITSFTIGGTTTVEVGAKVTSVPFTWVIANPTSVKTAKIFDIVANAYVYTIPTVDIASGSYTLTVDITKTAAFTQSYRLDVVDGNDKSYSNTKTVVWAWAVYNGTNAGTSVNEAAAEAMTRALKSGFAGTYTFAAAAGYKYVIYPDALGTATSFKDAATGLNVPMEAATTLSITNASEVVANYRVHRTTNIINGAINIIAA